MKKTLITLAALAASVASAATLDFNTATSSTEVDFTGGDTIILTEKTTLSTVITETHPTDWKQNVWTTTIQSGTVTVTPDDTKRLFGVHNDGGADNGTNRVLNNATIDFGTKGELVANQDGNINLHNMNLTLKAALTFIVVTDDTEKLTKGYGMETRTLFSSDAAVWNNNMMNNSYTMSISSANTGITLADKTSTAGNGQALANTLKDITYNGDSLGQWAVYNGSGSDISIAYVVQYVAASGGDGNVPEPTTATLSLLALAGLAARRRRK